MTDPDDPETIAKRRFQLIGVVRLCGVVFVALGFILWQTDLVGVRAPNLGRVVIAGGLFVLLVIPALLLRRWRRQAGR